MGASPSQILCFQASWIGAGVEDENDSADGGNYLGILTLGWCYNLSACLVELQGDGASLRYTESKAMGVLRMGLAKIPQRLLLILARSMRRFPGGGRRSLLRVQAGKPSSRFLPMASFWRPGLWRTWVLQEAFESLAQFALLHNTGSQFLVALATAITVPTHSGARCSAAAAAPATKSIPQDWAADVPCTLVSPWLHPILNEHLCALAGRGGGWARPDDHPAGPTGQAASRPGRVPVDGLCTELMERPIRGSYVDAQPMDWIWRADVWWLLHWPVVEEDGVSYARPPRTPWEPWEPWGIMGMRDCALRVLAHLGCAWHEFRYCCWSWELEGGEVVHDLGVSPITQIDPATPDIDPFCVGELGLFPYKPLDQEASQEVSLEVFRWSVVNGEGVPAENLYRDEWLAGLDMMWIGIVRAVEDW
ncbi:hypothetical protein BO82DRAFT_429670 [Aspergillus uvarum CBS 121591]|uniref:Uncharacterized protein n=1 Tax=Aspergillus uvarum CBS 121591 TaxID=1448315 RepID=A0A319CKT6_9EURO|nr:hypothetical protein BO82DRAFT_429670 [Aspergillus uvarum CBS 121591]PYH85180.1 hypothetical protein BO82DRAFT_429670 [Aspergillus uvarum CBS 121591]